MFLIFQFFNGHCSLCSGRAYLLVDVCAFVVLFSCFTVLFSGAARQVLISVILSRSIYLSMYVRRFSPLQRPLQSAEQPSNSIRVLLSRNTVGVRNVFLSALCGCMSPHYNLSPVMKIADIRVWDLTQHQPKRLPACCNCFYCRTNEQINK